ncbi:MAG TPA: nitronate monooxygenase family protein [Candidatus Binataceae bacterium]|nr:nitronate monooxygenase family protein [Candidatus Binataceae bacterium]
MTRPVLRTVLCDILDIEYPIILAGMGEASGPELTAAVSNAGGLGVLGAALLGGDDLAAAIEKIRKLTSKPFGVDTLLPSGIPAEGEVRAKRGELPTNHFEFAKQFKERHHLPEPQHRWPRLSQDFFKKQLEVIFDLRVPIYAAGLGNPASFVKAAHAQGMKIMAVGGNTKHVRRMREAGLDVIVAQGTDAGGHNSRIGTMALIPQAVDAAMPTPLVAAGGIADGRGLAAALALGACGVWVGTAFLATPESSIPQYQKEALLRASEEDTMVSRALTGKPSRHIKNLWSEEFEASGLKALPMPFQGMISASIMLAAEETQRADIYSGFAGQIVGMINEMRPAAKVLEAMVSQAHHILGQELRARVNLG